MGLLFVKEEFWKGINLIEVDGTVHVLYGPGGVWGRVARCPHAPGRSVGRGNTRVVW